MSHISFYVLNKIEMKLSCCEVGNQSYSVEVQFAAAAAALWKSVKIFRFRIVLGLDPECRLVDLHIKTINETKH